MYKRFHIIRPTVAFNVQQYNVQYYLRIHEWTSTKYNQKLWVKVEWSVVTFSLFHAVFRFIFWICQKSFLCSWIFLSVHSAWIAICLQHQLTLRESHPFISVDADGINGRWFVENRLEICNAISNIIVKSSFYKQYWCWWVLTNKPLIFFSNSVQWFCHYCVNRIQC